MKELKEYYSHAVFLWNLNEYKLQSKWPEKCYIGQVVFNACSYDKKKDNGHYIMPSDGNSCHHPWNLPAKVNKTKYNVVLIKYFI